jgi:uncharacterized SAM-binding protein YcdF (DUF218 family)
LSHQCITLFEMRLHQMKIILIITLPIVLLGTTLFLIHERILLAIGDFLVIQDELQPADAIHVMSVSDNTRVDYAIQLYKQGFAKQIIFTGGWCPCTQANSAEYSKARALQQGVPAQAIVIDGSEVTSTYAEIVQLKEVISHSPVAVRSLIGVSDPFHMRRARWTYRHVLGDQVSLQMAPVPFEAGLYQRRWWTDEASRQYVKDEYLKIAYYYARYKFSMGPVRGWLASFDTD